MKKAIIITIVVFVGVSLVAGKLIYDWSRPIIYPMGAKSGYFCSYPRDNSTSLLPDNILVEEGAYKLILTEEDVNENGWGYSVYPQYVSREGVIDRTIMAGAEHYFPTDFDLKLVNIVEVYSTSEEATDIFNERYRGEKSILHNFNDRLKIGDEMCSVYDPTHSTIEFRENNLIIEISISKIFYESDYRVTKPMLEQLLEKYIIKLEYLNSEERGHSRSYE